MKIECATVECNSETLLLLKAIALAISFGTCDASSEEFDDEFGAIYSGVGTEFAKFQQIKEGEQYSEREWAAKIILSGTRFLKLYKAGLLQALPAQQAVKSE